MLIMSFGSACSGIQGSGKKAEAGSAINDGTAENRAPTESLATQVQANAATSGAPEWASKPLRSLFDTEANTTACIESIAKSTEHRECNDCLTGNRNTGGGSAAACQTHCAYSLDDFTQTLRTCKGLTGAI